MPEFETRLLRLVTLSGDGVSTVDRLQDHLRLVLRRGNSKGRSTSHAWNSGVRPQMFRCGRGQLVMVWPASSDTRRRPWEQPIRQDAVTALALAK
jgi:hypothetical protein